MDVVVHDYDSARGPRVATSVVVGSRYRMDRGPCGCRRARAARGGREVCGSETETEGRHEERARRLRMMVMS